MALLSRGIPLRGGSEGPRLGEVGHDTVPERGDIGGNASAQNHAGTLTQSTVTALAGSLVTEGGPGERVLGESLDRAAYDVALYDGEIGGRTGYKHSNESFVLSSEFSVEIFFILIRLDLVEGCSLFWSEVLI